MRIFAVAVRFTGMSNATPAKFLSTLILELECRAAAETDPAQRERLERAAEHYRNSQTMVRAAAKAASS